MVIGQIHEQTIDVKDSAEENEEEVSECIKAISDKLKRLLKK